MFLYFYFYHLEMNEASVARGTSIGMWFVRVCETEQEGSVSLIEVK